MHCHIVNGYRLQITCVNLEDLSSVVISSEMKAFRSYALLSLLLLRS